MYNNLNKIILTISCVLVFSIKTNAQEIMVINNKGTIATVNNNTVTTANVAPTNPVEDDLWFNTTTTPNTISVWNGTAWLRISSTPSNWLITGNSGTTPANFLGTIDDVKMQIRSFNIPMLEFGRRQTLGLTNPGRFDYDDPDQPLVYLKGDNNISALQFAAAGADIYKPMFFTTTNGSFRLKGSSGKTDIFEIGSAGPDNDGRLEFIVGDDGNEPFIFKRFHHLRGGFYRELFRVQGHDGGPDAKTRFGINLNQAEQPVPANINAISNGVNNIIANSTFQVVGSVSKSITEITTGTGNFLLTEDHHTISVKTNRTILLPNAIYCNGRIYVIKNTSGVSINSSRYLNNESINTNTITNNTIIWLQSDGANWQLVSETKNTPGATPSPSVTNGDIKYGVQNTDHSGWYLLNGRATTSISATARAVAAGLGFGANLPDATNRVLKHPRGGEAVGNTGGQVNTTLIRANLPNINFPTTISEEGNHSHTIPKRTRTMQVLNGSDNNLNFYNRGGNSPTDAAGAHRHNITVRSGGVNRPFERYQPYLVVNTFIYLGL